ncbi:MAG: alpha/beta hydrolase [Candidatus Rariloculaceae bacterium]
MTSRATSVERFSVDGPAGNLEAIEERQGEAEPAAVALLCHPHPLYGGTMENKVVHTLARSFLNLGCLSIRFNFRGVGESAGSYGDGVWETEDVIAVAKWIRASWPGKPFYLGGFSFGAAVALNASAALDPDGLVTVAPPTDRLAVDYDPPGCPWLVIQGDADDVVAAVDIIEWLNGLEPGPELQMLEGAGHFFHGRLIELRDNVVAFFQPAFAPGQQPRGS